jgi:hypothetical protein
MEDTPEPTQTYLHEDVEVMKTGRTATRKLRSNKVDERVEITPVEKFDGTWKKWVRLTDLYEIE